MECCENSQFQYLDYYPNVPTKEGAFISFSLYKCQCGKMFPIDPIEKENFDRLLTQETKQKIFSGIRN